MAYGTRQAGLARVQSYADYAGYPGGLYDVRIRLVPAEAEDAPAVYWSAQ